MGGIPGLRRSIYGGSSRRSVTDAAAHNCAYQGDGEHVHCQCSSKNSNVGPDALRTEGSAAGSVCWYVRTL